MLANFVLRYYVNKLQFLAFHRERGPSVQHIVDPSLTASLQLGYLLALLQQIKYGIWFFFNLKKSFNIKYMGPCPCNIIFSKLLKKKKKIYHKFGIVFAALSFINGSVHWRQPRQRASSRRRNSPLPPREGRQYTATRCKSWRRASNSSWQTLGWHGVESGSDESHWSSIIWNVRKNPM